MKLIVGLGNPGERYTQTRHNAGFRVVDELAERLGWRWAASRERALVTEGVTAGQKLLLIKPTTYMNDSGRAVAPLLRFYKLTLADLLVICDDLDLPVGRVRLRERGSPGGQNGLGSVITHLGSPDFARLRVGIGRPANGRMSIIDYVLGIPPAEDRVALAESEARAVDAALAWAAEGTQATMNRFNTDPTAAPRLKKSPVAEQEPGS
ncbi:MAG: aminoacyl-tRNA hydrolase [Ktedonobacterales bacterium]|nr:aminoacyl-tRNA hydrolase [Ktedonobacterales bacterium]